MQNKLLEFVRQQKMIQPGDAVVCAVSGGADSVALLWAMYLLKDKLKIQLSAAHFNHCLRGEESDRDEAFVRKLCDRYDIPLAVGRAAVETGPKGLEAAARDARYSFLRALPGKIATAHTADDNAETVLLHLVRGTGLKGLGAIAPVNGNVIRPMLGVTRQEVEAFLFEYSMPFITDSSNEADDFLRNRLRHHVIPLLKQENPKLAENLSAMALRLREDEKALEQLAQTQTPGNIPELRSMIPAMRTRALEAFLKENGVREPEADHIALVESLIFSKNPSAKASFPGGVTIGRNYDRLVKCGESAELETRKLSCPGMLELPEIGLRVICEVANTACHNAYAFTVSPVGEIILRHRLPGDGMKLSGGSKQLKKLFIDRKIPADRRMLVPVIADEQGILGVCGIGADLSRQAEEFPAVQIRFEQSNP